MQLGIRLWMEERRSLSDKREQIKETLPERVHREHAVGHVAMQKKALGKYASVPVDYEKADDYQHGSWFPELVDTTNLSNPLSEQVVGDAPLSAVLIAEQFGACQEK